HMGAALIVRDGVHAPAEASRFALNYASERGEPPAQGRCVPVKLAGAEHETQTRVRWTIARPVLLPPPRENQFARVALHLVEGHAGPIAISVKSKTLDWRRERQGKDENGCLPLPAHSPLHAALSRVQRPLPFLTASASRSWSAIIWACASSALAASTRACV